MKLSQQMALPARRAFVARLLDNPATRERLLFISSIVVVVAVAIGLRAAWAHYSPAEPRPPRFDDSVFYYEMAKNIASGAGYQHPITGFPTAQWPPGYPSFLAALFSVTGASAPVGEAANAILGGFTAAATIALTYALLRDRVAGVLSGLLVATAPGSIFMAGVLWSETLFTFIFVCALVLIVRIPTLHGWRRMLGLVCLAALIAAAALTREAGLALLPIAACYWALTTNQWRLALRWAALVSVCALASIAPWAVRNYFALDSFVFVSSSSAGNLWQGHHEEVDAFPDDDLVSKYGPLTERGGEARVARGAWKDALHYIRTHPKDEALAPFSKTREMYQGDPAGLDMNDVYEKFPFMDSEQRDRIEIVTDVMYYLLLSLAGVGLIRSGPRSPVARLCIMTVAFWTLGHIVYFADPRFHMPVIPVFACLAAAGLRGDRSAQEPALPGRAAAPNAPR